MANKNNNTDWIAKEKRELFCKSINSMIMNTDEMNWKEIDIPSLLKTAKLIVDTAFKNYPDQGPEEKEQEMPF